MYRLLAFLLFFMLPGISLSEEPEKPEFTDDQLNRLKAAEEKYKDSPEIMNLIGRLKDQYGLDEESPEKQTAPEPVPQEPALQGDHSIAETAYKNRDYATAIEHYKALAAEGDAEASLKLGTMYEMGQGTGKDPAAAHAWYKKAADEGETRAKIFLKSIEKTALSEEDLATAEETYKQISLKPDDESPAGEDDQSGGDMHTRFALLPGIIPGDWQDTGYTQPREVRITPEKFNPAHPRPALNVEHIQLQKFNRNHPAGPSSDS
jgi:hypothetical protein